MNKRVLLVAKFLDSSGVTTHMFNLARGLASLGWNVAIASGGQAGEHSYGPKTFESNGIPHLDVPFPRLSFSVGDFIRAGKSYLKMDAVVRKFNPDIIHVHYRSTSPYVRAIQLQHQIPFVTTIHIEGLPDSFLHKITTFWGDRCISISADTSKYLIHNLSVSPSKIRLVYNGVDDSYFRPPTEAERCHARQKWNLGQEDKVVSIVARLEHTKGHDILIKALALLRAKGCDVIALVAGEGSMKKAFVQQAATAGVSDLVRFIGHTDSREVFWASDVSVLPSRVEGFGLVTVESMLCRVVPVRTPAAGAYEQIEDGNNGFIVLFEDYEALAMRLQQLLADKGLRNKMAEAALLTAKNKFTQKTMLEKTIAVYKEVLP
ncbi:glycosyltransferase family 4 protein [Fischerella sp. PCC 9605]|uniref:glycosyltransferase family 4 protein n=1 Tax=Fischerella sp. PCC 9605 TaxID=1173024 RepID=UPI00047EB9D0|nr:glycosyltransferase family 4 protein [Fischerella sp. PCC 9605]